MLSLPPISEQNLQSLAGLIDAGLRASGLRAVREVTYLLDWLEQATPIEEKDQEENKTLTKKQE